MDRHGSLGRLFTRLYGRPIIRNVLRGELAEQLVLDALGAGWTAAGDYEPWDIESVDGKTRIQVKQSAARQSWAVEDCTPTTPRFSIKASKSWTESVGRATQASRHSSFYIFAWHPLVDASADHRVPEQWEFYIVSTSRLPEQDSISLSFVRSLCLATAFDEIGSAILPMLTID